MRHTTKKAPRSPDDFETARTLPFEGITLLEMSIDGNGKDADLEFVSADGRSFVIDSSGQAITIVLRGTVRSEVFGLGDCSLAIRYTGNQLVLRTARIQYDGTPEEWIEDEANLAAGRSMLWGISAGYFELVAEAGAD